MLNKNKQEKLCYKNQPNNKSNNNNNNNNNSNNHIDINND